MKKFDFTFCFVFPSKHNLSQWEFMTPLNTSLRILVSEFTTILGNLIGASNELLKLIPNFEEHLLQISASFA
jgi:hypothetical protein